MRSRPPTTEAGRLQTYAQITTAQFVPDADNWGTEAPAYQVVASIWCNVYPLMGDEAWRAQREAGIAYWNVECRWLDIANPSVAVNASMQIRIDGPEPQTIILEIESIQHLDLARDRAVMRCKRIQ